MGNTFASTASPTEIVDSAVVVAESDSPFITGLIKELKADKDGRHIALLEEAFIAALANANVQRIRQHMTELGHEGVRLKFLELDTDGNGLLDSTEAKAGFTMIVDQILAIKCGLVTKATVDLLTAAMDADGDGNISVEEVLVFCLGEAKGAAAAKDHAKGILPNFTPPPHLKGASARSEQATALEMTRRHLQAEAEASGSGSELELEDE
eukprot:COSAG02_NODE_3217_length_7156_cov_5.216381_3_plen_210_part_00